jgi:hypothetical protein
MNLCVDRVITELGPACLLHNALLSRGVGAQSNGIEHGSDQAARPVRVEEDVHRDMCASAIKNVRLAIWRELAIKRGSFFFLHKRLSPTVSPLSSRRRRRRRRRRRGFICE